MVEAELAQLLIDYEAEHQQVCVAERDGPRQIVILVGTSEAMALQRIVENLHPERPMTHELLDSVVRGLGGQVARVEITGLKNATFHARLVLRDVDGKEIPLEARPSDSIPLAVRAGAPLYVDEEVLVEAGVVA